MPAPTKYFPGRGRVAWLAVVALGVAAAPAVAAYTIPQVPPTVTSVVISDSKLRIALRCDSPIKCKGQLRATIDSDVAKTGTVRVTRGYSIRAGMTTRYNMLFSCRKIRRHVKRSTDLGPMRVEVFARTRTEDAFASIGTYSRVGC